MNGPKTTKLDNPLVTVQYSYRITFSVRPADESSDWGYTSTHIELLAPWNLVNLPSTEVQRSMLGAAQARWPETEHRSFLFDHISVYAILPVDLDLVAVYSTSDEFIRRELSAHAAKSMTADQAVETVFSQGMILRDLETYGLAFLRVLNDIGFDVAKKSE